MERLSRNSNVIVESLLYGVSKNLVFLETETPAKLNYYYEQLTLNDNFSENNLKNDLASKTKVLGRLAAAETIFSGK